MNMRYDAPGIGAATFTPAERSYLPARHPAADRLADSWRHLRAELADHIFYIRQYRRYLDTGSMPSYRRHIKAALASRVRSYSADLRSACDAEARMEAAGVQFKRVP